MPDESPDEEQLDFFIKKQQLANLKLDHELKLRELNKARWQAISEPLKIVSIIVAVGVGLAGVLRTIGVF
jgi:hypothetical protein